MQKTDVVLSSAGPGGESLSCIGNSTQSGGCVTELNSLPAVGSDLPIEVPAAIDGSA